MNNAISYIELPASNTPALKAFYGALFNWTFQDYGPDYSSFSNSGVEGGFNAVDNSERAKTALIIIETNDVYSMERRVAETGGTITKPTFAFPGGRRFHFKDPAGNELAVMQLGE